MDRSTGKPLRGVHVRMISLNAEGNGVVGAVYGATSDAAGHFSMENLKPGLYFVIGERAGYVQVPASTSSPLGFAMVTLKSGQHLADQKLEMTPRALIAGPLMGQPSISQLSACTRTGMLHAVPLNVVA